MLLRAVAKTTGNFHAVLHTFRPSATMNGDQFGDNSLLEAEQDRNGLAPILVLIDPILDPMNSTVPCKWCPVSGVTGKKPKHSLATGSRYGLLRLRPNNKG